MVPWDAPTFAGLELTRSPIGRWKSVSYFLVNEAVGLTDEVLTFSGNIAHDPETWLDFPVEDDEDCEAPKSIDKRTRIWDDTNKFSKVDLIINQAPGAPLPSGIPTYSVGIVNVCASGCAISQIHLCYGWFSSAFPIGPMIFKRIRFNDCVINAGRTLHSGQSFKFQYANICSYPLSISSMSCLLIIRYYYTISHLLAYFE
ncbi:TPD1 protein homolog 1-like [Spinacia oleracea]|uniref:TPD1 protein homolog 1-like n=1 Tax=Spinacia oleracea TaxID=3562 RepID=A0ABM3QXP7_SPIOL|nr:TPD1 protein homolog 1-like [Spinacia oleracea]